MSFHSLLWVLVYLHCYSEELSPSGLGLRSWSATLCSGSILAHHLPLWVIELERRGTGHWYLSTTPVAIWICLHCAGIQLPGCPKVPDQVTNQSTAFISSLRTKMFSSVSSLPSHNHKLYLTVCKEDLSFHKLLAISFVLRRVNGIYKKWTLCCDVHISGKLCTLFFCVARSLTAPQVTCCFSQKKRPAALCFIKLTKNFFSSPSV